MRRTGPCVIFNNRLEEDCLSMIYIYNGLLSNGETTFGVRPFMSIVVFCEGISTAANFSLCANMLGKMHLRTLTRGLNVAALAILLE